MKRVAYFIIRNYVRVALWFFYKELKLQGLEHIPKDKPIILTPNHQNSFMDAVLIACMVPRPIYFLTRASIFKSQVAKWFLELLNMMPIYRFRDGIKDIKKNGDTIESCTKLLQKNKWLMIFPEGNHDMKYTIRPLQKGVGRIAFQALEQYDLDVLIIPVGIYYEDHISFRSRVLVNFGKPISTKSYYSLYKENSHEGLRDLVYEITSTLKTLTIHIDSNVYKSINEKWQITRVNYNNIVDQYNADQSLISRISAQQETVAENDLQINSKYRNNALLFPVFMYGAVNHLLPYAILHFIISKKVTDVHFYSSIKLSIGMVIVPMFYALQSILLYYCGLNLIGVLLYIFTLPVTGISAYYYWKRLNLKKS